MIYSLDLRIIILLLLVIAYIVILFLKKIKKNFKIFLTLILIVFSITYIVLENNNKSISNYLTSIKNSNNTELSLRLEDNVLFDNNTNDPINYLSYSKLIKYDFYPVYLKELSNNYIIIFSLDKTKRYDDGLFRIYKTQTPEVDFAITVSKTSGKVNIMRQFFHGGFITDFSKAVETTDQIIAPLYYVASNKFDSLLTFRFDETYPYVNIDFVFEKSADTIKKFAVDNNNVILMLSVNSEITLQREIITTNKNSTTRYNEHYHYLDQEKYVKQGYFTTIDGVIYYVNNNMDIYKINGSYSSFVKSIDSLTNWEDNIKD